MTIMTGRFAYCPVGELPSPGQCSCCGAYDRPCIHWGHDEDFVGVFLLCVNCVREAVGLFEPIETLDKAGPAVELVEALVKELDKTRESLARTAAGLAVDLVSYRARASVLEDELPIANGARKG